ncbi:hypothetical protein K438DRAFT_2118796 [Mycena galopus ATCC 62051]|nr:hypothetical protein K438DRAFT_2118796 [Mycena galopus ATCC 62051]
MPPRVVGVAVYVKNADENVAGILAFRGGECYFFTITTLGLCGSITGDSHHLPAPLSPRLAELYPLWQELWKTYLASKEQLIAAKREQAGEHLNPPPNDLYTRIFLQEPRGLVESSRTLEYSCSYRPTPGFLFPIHISAGTAASSSIGPRTVQGSGAVGRLGHIIEALEILNLATTLDESHCVRIAWMYGALERKTPFSRAFEMSNTDKIALQIRNIAASPSNFPPPVQPPDTSAPSDTSGPSRTRRRKREQEVDAANEVEGKRSRRASRRARGED